MVSDLAQAGRPLKLTPMSLPPLEKNEREARATASYPGAPVVKTVEPNFGLRHGWKQIEVFGSNFNKGLKLYIGGKEALRVRRVSSTHIQAMTPGNTFIGSADVIVENPDGKRGGLLNGFLYEGSIFEVPGYNVPPDWNWITDVKLVDMNKDGKRDFLLAAPWTPHEENEYGNLLIYLQGPDRDGDGVPNFERIRRNNVLNDSKSQFTNLAVGDLDKDGDMDFVAVGRVGLLYFSVKPLVNRVYLNDGSCNFIVKDLPGNAPSKGVEIGDVNRDGNPDIVIANMNAQSQLLLGDGKGDFRDATETHFPRAALWTSHIHLVDVDADGDLDAVLANTSSKKSKEGSPNLLYSNDGAGHYQDRTAAWAFPSGNLRSFKVDSADFDRDGDKDLVIAGAGQNQLLVNDGRGRFTVRKIPSYPVKDRHSGAMKDTSTSSNYFVTFSDMNVDGYPDLAVCAREASVMLYINVPDGSGGRTFKARPDLIDPRPAGHGSEAIALADVNGDRRPDLTIASGNEQTPLWINHGEKGFRFATCNVKQNLPYTDWVSRSCAIGDLNGDGEPDIAMGLHHEREVMLFLQGKEGWVRKDFVEPSVLTGKSVVETVAIADVDGDRDQDIVLGLRGQPSILLLNDGKANFETAKGPRALPRTPMGTSEILPVDVDLDGDTDLVMCNWERGLRFSVRGQLNSLFINEGGGRFVDRTGPNLPRHSASARGGAVGDVNRDGYPDIVLGCMKPSLFGKGMQNRLYLNRGKEAPGQFTDASHLLPGGKRKTTDAALCDVDGDGKLDIFFANELTLRAQEGEDQLYHQKTDGGFEDWSDHLPRINRNSWEVRVLDFNRDRAMDVLVPRPYWNFEQGYGPKVEYGRLLLYGNNGQGSFELPDVRPFGYMDQELDSWCGSCVGDLDGDGYPDIVESVDGQVRIHQTFLRTKAVAHPVYAEVRVGAEVEFDASSTHLPWGIKATSVSWQFGDGQKATGNKIKHRYKKPGRYRVTLKVTDSAGNQDADRVNVVVR